MRGLAASVLLAFAWSATAGEFRSIAENGTPMYDAPSVRAKKLFVASRLYPVEVVINIDAWIKVRDQAGDLSWVEKKALSDKRAARRWQPPPGRVGAIPVISPRFPFRVRSW